MEEILPNNGDHPAPSPIESKVDSQNVAEEMIDLKKQVMDVRSRIRRKHIQANKIIIARNREMIEDELGQLAPWQNVFVAAQNQGGDRTLILEGTARTEEPNMLSPLIQEDVAAPIVQSTLEGEKCEIVRGIVFPNLNPVPSYRAYVHLNRRSLRTKDDEVLRHVPYFGDDDVEGTDLTLFANTPRSLPREFSELEDETIRAVMCELAGTQDRSSLLHVLATVLKRAPDSIEKRMVQLETKSKQDWTAGVLDSYQSLFCRRCCLYDCDLHEADGVPRYLPSAVPDSPPTIPCSDSCYCCDSERNQKNGEKRRPWEDAENELLTELYLVFGSNSCKIAVVLVGRTCSEVKRGLEEDGTKSKFKKLRSIRYSGAGQKRAKGISLRDIHEYTPCSHEGPCRESCSCVQGANFCEKYCRCAVSCGNRFPGCMCRGAGKLLCVHNRKSCWCAVSGRECDPDICECCVEEDQQCDNQHIRLGKAKKLAIGPSTVAGWGAFIVESAAPHEYIAEYIGENISQIEAERRGMQYDREGMSFLFNLTQNRVVDASRMGNVTRFVNHSSTPNCYPKVLLVQGEYKIGFFAKRSIDAYEELFFDYGYDKHQGEKFIPLEPPKNRRKKMG